MKTQFKTFLIIAFLVLSFFCVNKLSFCQWQYNGGNIYNTNPGNVGIGTMDPVTSLHVVGPLRLSFNVLNNLRNWEFNYDIPGQYFYLDEYGIDRHISIQSFTGNVGIGTTSPTHKLEVNGSFTASDYGDFISLNGSANGYTLKLKVIGTENWGIEFNPQPSTKTLTTGKFTSLPGNYYGMGLRIMDNSNNMFYIRDNYTGNIRMMINQGWVGIGTTTPDLNYRLSVNGSIRAKEIRVETGWYDFVFNKDYQLLSLAELENYINKNKHLPDIPSEQEVKENGVELGNMSAKLLQKVEELTLYVINLNKEKDSMKSEIENLKKQNEELMDHAHSK